MRLDAHARAVRKPGYTKQTFEEVMVLNVNHRPTRATQTALRHVRKSLSTRITQIQSEPDGEFIRRFPTLVAAVEAGLRHEESIFETLGFRHLRECRAGNAIIQCALHRAALLVEQGDVELGRQITAALADVLVPLRLVSVLALVDGPVPPQVRGRPARSRKIAHPARPRRQRRS